MTNQNYSAQYNNYLSTISYIIDRYKITNCSSMYISKLLEHLYQRIVRDEGLNSEELKLLCKKVNHITFNLPSFTNSNTKSKLIIAK